MNKVSQMLYCSRGNLSHTRLLIFCTWLLAVFAFIANFVQGGFSLHLYNIALLVGIFLGNVIDRMNARKIEASFSLKDGAALKVESGEKPNV